MDKGKLIRFKRVQDLIGKDGGVDILDLGCGSCDIKPFLSYDSYLGVDKYPGGDIVHDLEDGLPLDIGLFDIIVMSEFIEHIEKFRSLLVDCKDHLRDGGYIIVSSPSANRLLYGDLFGGVGEDLTHIHCFKKSNMRNLARITGLVITGMVGCYVRVLPILRPYLVVSSRQTFYNEVIVYRLEVK